MLPPMRRFALLALAMAGCGSKSSRPQQPPPPLREVAPNELRAVADFSAIADREARSLALFTEAARVIMHPRCVNCHPDGDTPYQGMTLALHEPPVVRGPENNGVPGNECTTCHQERNQELTRVPGAPKWHVAPRVMAWVGKSAAHICNQLKDTKRNGGKSLAQIAEHSAHDELVAWGWSPGANREPAPGTQEQFGALVAAWIDSGAECPEEAPR